MPIIQWNESMCVGVKIIDKEHKHLVDIVNDLSDAIENGSGHTVLSVSLNNVVSFVNFHFKHEEELFSATAYPLKEEHIKEHKALYKKITVLQEKYMANPTNENMIEVFIFFKKLFMYHATEVDIGFAKYMQEAGFS